MRPGLRVIARLVLAVLSAFAGTLRVPVPLSAFDETPPTASQNDTPASLLSLNDEDLRRRIESDPGSLGPLSIGTPGSGLLLNAVTLPLGPRWEIAPGADSCGTSETIAAVQTTVNTVHELFPETQPIAVGDISGCDGGRLKSHDTHQAGRDVDFGFYYKAGKGTWYAPGTAASLDLPRNWVLVRALVVRTDVEAILLDTRIQRLLYTYALSIGEEKEWLDRVFQFSRGSPEPIVRHVAGHRTHYHVRFYSPVAQELGRRAHPTLVDLGIIKPPVYTARHLVRPGETLGHLATRYRTSVRAIMQANGLATTQIRAGRAYRIPLRTPAPPPQPILVPRRLLPSQTPAAMASVDWPTVASLYGEVEEALDLLPRPGFVSLALGNQAQVVVTPGVGRAVPLSAGRQGRDLLVGLAGLREIAGNRLASGEQVEDARVRTRCATPVVLDPEVAHFLTAPWCFESPRNR